MAENINRVVYQLSLDTKTTIKSKVIVGTQVGESIALDITLTDNDGLTPRDLTNCEIDFACLMNNENNESVFYKQNYNEIEDGQSLFNVISATNGRIIVYLRKNFTYRICNGMGEIHIRNTQNEDLIVTNRFLITISESFTTEIPNEILMGAVTLKNLEEMMNNYISLYNDMKTIKNSNQINHVHINYNVLNKLDEQDGTLYFNGSPLLCDNNIGGESPSGVDLSGYFNKEEVTNLLLNKVDVVDGKVLSDNNYTTTEKTKLNSLNNYNDSELKLLIAQLNASKSDVVHFHSGYADISHNHSTVYSSISHNHDNVYQTKLSDTQLKNINDVVVLKTEIANLQLQIDNIMNLISGGGL